MKTNPESLNSSAEQREHIMSKEKLKSVGDLIFPVLAIAFSSYMIIHQYLQGFRTSTLVYAVMLSIPVFICGLIPIIQFFLSLWKEKKESPESFKVPEAEECETEGEESNYKKPLGILAISILTLLVIYYTGFVIGMFVLMVLLLPVLGVRSPMLIAVFSILIPVIFYFVFAKLIGLQIPLGILEGIL